MCHIEPTDSDSLHTGLKHCFILGCLANSSFAAEFEESACQECFDIECNCLIGMMVRNLP